jgi:hypothetical protein
VVRLAVLAAAVIGFIAVAQEPLVRVLLAVMAVSQRVLIVAAGAVVPALLGKLVIRLEHKVVMAVLGQASASLAQPYFMQVAAAVEAITVHLMFPVDRAVKAAVEVVQTNQEISKLLLERQILAVALAVVARITLPPIKAKAVVLELSSSAIHSKLLDRPHLLLSI